MAGFPWFSFYPSDWLSSLSTTLMTLEQRGAYIQLLCHAWLSKTNLLPADEARLQRLVGWQEQHGDFSPVLACFPLHPDVLNQRYNPRLNQEWRKAEMKSELAKASVDTRWKQTRRRSPIRPEKDIKRNNGTGVWEAYATAYTDTYSVPPTRNAKTNALCAKFVARVGIADAPVIAAWYLSHRAQLYVQAGHCLELLLRDAEKLRTEWTRGQTITTTRARQLDQGSAMQQGVREAKAILDRHKTGKEPNHD